MNNEIPFDWYNRLISTGELPTRKEVIDTVSENGSWWSSNNVDDWWNNSLAKTMCRTNYVHQYSFPLITQEVANDMANFLLGKRVLEVCAGNGYIAKCITDINSDMKSNVKFICTDNYSWEGNEADTDTSFGNWSNHFYPVEKLDSVEAINKYHNEIDFVMVSWPPYSEPVAYEILKKCIEYKLPLIYIGEDWGGCTGDDRFFELISDKCIMESSIITNNYIPFEGIHDRIYVIKIKE